MTHKDMKEFFVSALYGELRENEKAQFDEHLASCETCSSEFKQLQETLQVLNLHKREEPDDAYWSGYWQQLNAKLAESTTSRPNIFQFFPATLRVPVWTYGIAAVLLVVFGVYLGRNHFASHDQSNASTTAVTAATNQTTSADTLNAQALAYLERSRNLLIGLVNLDPEDRSSLAFSRQQHVSRELIQQSHYLKAALNKPDQQLMRQLILDLEVILLQLANLETDDGVHAVELVKKGVDQKSILLKINLEAMRTLAKHLDASKNTHTM